MKIHASKTIPFILFCFLFFFISDYINPIQSNIKLIECVTLCYSCPIKATWIHKALLQQIRVISFFYLTYVMTYKNQKKVYLCIPIIVAILYSVQNIVRTVCVWERVCVCYESLMSITMVQCSIKVKSKGQQTCYKKTHKMSPFCPNLVFLQTQSAASSSLNGFHSDFQSWSSWGLSHGADYASLSREMLRGFIKKQKKSTRIQMCLQKTLSVWPFHSV